MNNANLKTQETKEYCYIVNLNLATQHIERHVKKYWSKVGANNDLLNNTVLVYVDKFVFGIAQGIGKCFATPNNIQPVHDISSIVEHYTIQLSIANNLSLDDANIKVMHLKKIIEDFIIVQLTAAMNNNGLSNPTIQRYSSHQSLDGKFLYCC